MAWNRKPAPATTKHTCGGPVFGRLSPKTCPRCFELQMGAPAVQWAPSRKEQDARRAAAIAHHFKHVCSPKNCGAVCTFGDW